MTTVYARTWMYALMPYGVYRYQSEETLFNRRYQPIAFRENVISDPVDIEDYMKIIRHTSMGHFYQQLDAAALRRCLAVLNAFKQRSSVDEYIINPRLIGDESRGRRIGVLARARVGSIVNPLNEIEAERRYRNQKPNPYWNVRLKHNCFDNEWLQELRLRLA